MIDKSVKQVTISKAHFTSKFGGQALFSGVPDLFQWVIVATGSKHIEDVTKPWTMYFLSWMLLLKLQSYSVCKAAHRHSDFNLIIRSAPMSYAAIYQAPKTNLSARGFAGMGGTAIGVRGEFKHFWSSFFLWPTSKIIV